MKIDKMIDNITIKPEEFRLKGIKNQKNSIMLFLNNNSIDSRKIFFYNDLDELASYPLFLETLYCNDHAICMTQDINLDDLRKHFMSFRNKAIKSKMKILYALMSFYDDIDNTGLEEKIKELDQKLKEK